MTYVPLKGLLARREARDFSQAKLAKVIDVTQSQYGKFEKGLVRLDVHRAAKLARFLKCRIEDLI